MIYGGIFPRPEIIRIVRLWFFGFCDKLYEIKLILFQSNNIWVPVLELTCFANNYNMVGVAVAMVISTMHEKSCIDSHNAREFEKSSKIQSFTHLAITMMKVRKYHSHEFFKL